MTPESVAYTWSFGVAFVRPPNRVGLDDGGCDEDLLTDRCRISLPGIGGTLIA
jgi:hypothetical protein